MCATLPFVSALSVTVCGQPDRAIPQPHSHGGLWLHRSATRIDFRVLPRLSRATSGGAFPSAISRPPELIPETIRRRGELKFRRLPALSLVEGVKLIRAFLQTSAAPPVCRVEGWSPHRPRAAAGAPARAATGASARAVRRPPLQKFHAVAGLKTRPSPHISHSSRNFGGARRRSARVGPGPGRSCGLAVP